MTILFIHLYSDNNNEVIITKTKYYENSINSRFNKHTKPIELYK
jgi:hypothetical protein